MSRLLSPMSVWSRALAGLFAMAALALTAPPALASGGPAIQAAKKAPPTAPRKSAGKQLLELNTATIDQLVELPGVGPKTAEKIVAYAKSTGFRSVEDLLEVKGIGEKKLAKLRPLVRVDKTKIHKGKSAK